MIVKRPSSNKIDIYAHKLDYLTSYPKEILLLDFYDYSGSVLQINPMRNRNDIVDYVISINNVLYENIFDTTLSLDLTLTGLGGLIDGITFVAANARDFLIWAIASDVNTEFLGFALTHKPYSTYTAPATANKGSSYAFTVTNGFQFTAGARVAVRNTNGTAPLYQWNWGTITSVNSNTSITILMDNNANYGSNLTAVTGGEIVQWDQFRPWVVGATQDLYSDNYRLIGELCTDTSGNIAVVTRVDDTFRSIPDTLIYNSTALTAGTTFAIGRVIPLWTKSVDASVLLQESTATTAGTPFSVRNPINQSGLKFQSQVNNAIYRASGRVYLGSDSQIAVRANSANITDFRTWVHGYYVPGGMRA
jgi:hypothetical protein